MSERCSLNPELPRPSDEYSDLARRMGGYVLARRMGFVFAVFTLLVLSAGFLLDRGSWFVAALLFILELFFCALALDPKLAVDKIEVFLNAIPKSGRADEGS